MRARTLAGSARATAFAILALACFQAGAGQPAPPPAPSLAEGLEAHLRQPAFARATWGLHVALADASRVLFATNDAVLLKPASNAKLFTAALVLDHLGPTGRIRTDLRLDGRVTRRGTLHGDLVVYGRGDVSAAARFHPRPFAPLVNSLRAAGVRRISGSVVADDSAFTGDPYGTGWTWDDTRFYYGAPVGALNCDDNLIEVIVRRLQDSPRLQLQSIPDTRYFQFDTALLTNALPGQTPGFTFVREAGSRSVRLQGGIPENGAVTNEIPVPSPAHFYAWRLTEELERAGIRVGGPPRHQRGAMAAGARSGHGVSLAIESPPAAELAGTMLRVSQNLYAQALLLHVGSTSHPDGSGSGTAPSDTESAGVQACRRFLDRIGIPPEEVLLDEGSGLSRSALVTPRAIVGLLRSMQSHPAADAFFGGLPLAGREGSLRRRLRGTAAEGNLRAKTGTLRYVHALSGMVTNREGHRVLFSVLLNTYAPPPGGPTGREAVDEIARLIAERAIDP